MLSVLKFVVLNHANYGELLHSLLKLDLSVYTMVSAHIYNTRVRCLKLKKTHAK